MNANDINTHPSHAPVPSSGIRTDVTVDDEGINAPVNGFTRFSWIVCVDATPYPELRNRAKPKNTVIDTSLRIFVITPDERIADHPIKPNESKTITIKIPVSMFAIPFF